MQTFIVLLFEEQSYSLLTSLFLHKFIIQNQRCTSPSLKTCSYISSRFKFRRASWTVDLIRELENFPLFLADVDMFSIIPLIEPITNL